MSRASAVRVIALLPILAAVLLAPASAAAAWQVPEPARAAASLPASPLAGIEAFIERGMADWRIPGLAVAVVQGDSVVYAQGFGVRRLGGSERVDEHTVFGIASVSKAFTAAALGLLVDEGRLSWDDPVVRYLPGFALWDPYVTHATTVRDLLSHRVGIGRMTGNRLRWLPARERAELIHRIRHLPPEQEFRSGYVYSNVAYMIAGELIPAITGESWERFVETRLFAPLGMRRSSAGYAGLMRTENRAWPHQEIEGRVVEIETRDFDAVGPSASINASVAELTAWMRLHLGEPGVLSGRRLVADTVVTELHRAQNVIRAPAFGPLASYGLGWSLGSYAGLRTSSHSGATDGMNTMLMLVHDAQLGVVVTTNTFNSFMVSLVNEIVDRMLDLPRRDWHEVHFGAYQSQYARVQAIRDSIDAAREPGTTPSVPLHAFAGRYYDDLYAEAEVLLEADGLVLRLWDDDTQVADLEHWHHDTFRAVWRNRAMREEFVWFTRAASGRIDALHVDWALRPDLLQVGAYPSGYRRIATWQRVAGR